jgi:glycosyltransferase involved in cell wall biosynthesis
MKLSICCITFNHQRFIAQALDGFLMQKTDFDFEIIISDDCSTDNTAAICNEYQKNYSEKIKLIKNKKNIGMMPNFIQALNQCEGKYIALCEGDDYWTDKNKLQKQVDFMEANPEYTICFHRVYEQQDKAKISLSRLNTSEKEETYNIIDLASGNFIHTPSVVYRNNLFIDFPEWFKKSPVGDYPLQMLNARFGSIRYFPEPMAVYRVHNGGIWSLLNKKETFEKWIVMLNYLIGENFEQTVIQKLVKQRRNYKERHLLILINQPEWKIFLQKLEQYSKQDEDLSQKWLLEYYPKYITSLKASRSYRFSESVRRFIYKFK